MLRITASLADGIPVDLQDTLTGLDDRNVQLLITAVLRSGHPVGGQLTEFMRRRGHPHPGLAACNLIDDLCFTAFGYRRLADNLLGQPTTALFANERASHS